MLKRPEFWENEEPGRSYYEQPDPYTNAPSCNVDLPALHRYARESGKKLAELSKEEVERFSINNRQVTDDK